MMKNEHSMITKTSAVAALILMTAFPALADVGHEHAAEIGQAAEESAADRVVKVDMDEMSFEPAELTVEKGETVKFVVTNTGRMVHEFNIGTDAMHDKHRREMLKMMQKGMMTRRDIREERMQTAGMMHDDPNSVLLEPGEKGEIVWKFSGSQNLEFACNVPGHRAGGMKGRIAIEDNPTKAR